MKKQNNRKPWTDGLSTAVVNALRGAQFESRAEVAAAMQSGKLRMEYWDPRGGFYNMVQRYIPVPGIGKKGVEEIRGWLSKAASRPDDEWTQGLSKKCASALLAAGFHSKKMVRDDLETIGVHPKIYELPGIGRTRRNEIREWAGADAAPTEPPEDKIFMNSLSPTLRKKLIKRGFYGKQHLLKRFLDAHYAELRYHFHGIEMYLWFLEPAEIAELRELIGAPIPDEAQIETAKVQVATKFLQDRGFLVRKAAEK